MSPSLDNAQSQWLAQLTAMREAIAELKIPTDGEKAHTYGQDILLDDDELSGTASGDDIWDLISGGWEDEYSSDHLDEVDGVGPAQNVYDQTWLSWKCDTIAQRSSGLNGPVLQEQIMAVLASDGNGIQL
jgi:antiviral helicase SLH1